MAGLQAAVLRPVTYTAEKDTEITGYLNLHLWVETEDADDADLFAAVCKTDVQGRRLYHITVAGEQRAGLAAAAAQRATLPVSMAYSRSLPPSTSPASTSQASSSGPPDAPNETAQVVSPDSAGA
ncbi:CocE/NonD family hydrolase C-terminal non-catalytic domain-containing protein [Streptomyces sp. SAS_272]|uniref:CocE/NonD family hydrolase C-terminal non-catalytic domain-containing protein n=1 Tax=Streptomyces sp. SAS_272 TaxID=3412747 RepID=UPI00403C26BD